MQYSQFQSDYPDIAGLLPQQFMTNADNENTLRRAIERDRTEYLDILNTLVRKTPAKEIRKDSSRLTNKTNFQSFYTELKAYTVLSIELIHMKCDFQGRPPIIVFITVLFHQ